MRNMPTLYYKKHEVYSDKPGHEGGNSKQIHMFHAQVDLNQRIHQLRGKSHRM